MAGFTLIEVMIVVVIIGILAAVAIPQYSDYVRRGQVPEATSTLANYRIQLEQYYQDNRNYGSGTCGGSLTTSTLHFTFTCTTDGQTYLATATGSTGASVGAIYTLDQNNVQSTTEFKGVSVSKTCWLQKGSEC